MSSPSGRSLIRRSRALPVALLACVVGLVLCGVTYAVAGPTVITKDIDLLDPMPEGVQVVDDTVSCTPSPFIGGDEYCTRVLVVRVPGQSGPDTADLLAVTYGDRGFRLNPTITDFGRTYDGTYGDCNGPHLYFAALAQPTMSGPMTTYLDPTLTAPSTTTTPSTPSTPSTTAVPVDPAAVPVDPAAVPVDPAAVPVDPAAAPVETTPVETSPVETTTVTTGVELIDPATVDPDPIDPGLISAQEQVQIVLAPAMTDDAC